MVDLTTRLTKKAVLLFKKQTAVGTEIATSAATDALEISEPEYAIDPTILERNNVADDLSPFAHVIGRKQATISFTTEFKGNGKAQSGVLTDAPMLARLMEVAGYALSATNTLATRVTDAVADFDNSASAPAVTFTKGGAPTLTKPIMYTMTVSTGGASGVAQVTVRGNDEVLDETLTDPAVTVTTAVTAVPLGASGATIMLTWTGTLIINTRYRFVVWPVGILAKPISESQPVGTARLYLDGLLHKMTDARADFSITAEAGNYGSLQFELQGNFSPAADTATPGGVVYDTTLPPQVEFSNLTWGSQRDLVAAQWTFEQQNTLTPRPDVNADEGVKGVRITARAPQGGFTPEATLEADHPFWDEIERGKCQTFFSKVGQTVGNQCAVFMPKAQLSALPYGDRDGIRTYDASFRCTRNVGNDEVLFWFG